MRHVLKADSLIGDLLMQTPAIRALDEARPREAIHYWVPQEDPGQHVSGTHVLLEGNPHLRGIHVGPDFPLEAGDRLVPMRALDAYRWAVANGKTIAQGFGQQLGVPVPDDRLDYTYRWTDAEEAAGRELAERLGAGKPVVAIARHSASCTSNDPKVGQPNKCAPNYLWVEVAQWLIARGVVPVALGSERELKDVRYRQWPGVRLYGAPIRTVAAFLAHCRATLAIDTGLRHLAAAVGGDLYCVSGVIQLSVIRCLPVRAGQRIFEEHVPLQHLTAARMIAGAEKVLG